MTDPPSKSEMALARAVRRLLLSHGRCHPEHRRKVGLDQDLAAYLRSVEEADAWREEVLRVRIRQAAKRRQRGDPPAPGTGMSLVVIMEYLPLWRSWGMLIRQAERQSLTPRQAPPAFGAQPRSS